MGGTHVREGWNIDKPCCGSPPVPLGSERARGAWSRSSVYDILRNAKYTGYQVYNRATRSRHGKVNDPVSLQRTRTRANRDMASALADLKQPGEAAPDKPTAADKGLVDVLPYLTKHRNGC
ncbi:recombinase family protein [Amycolatopsis sp. lyj-23]|uniref:recombinase family protein n=1 Tax=Amycolatopsis sp. lyj-23 TaxID=2789283 RepID=UPI00397D23E8